MTRGLVEAAGARLEYARWGSAEGLQVVLLHEGLGCVALWRDFPARLAEATGCGVVAWSRRGYGASSPVTLPRAVTYMQDEARDAVTPVLDALALGEFVLVGHSDGASIAAVYAGRHADARLRGLGLLAVHVMVEPVSLAGIREAKARWDAGELRPRLAKYHADVEGAFLGWNQAWLSEAFRDWDIRDALPGVRVPTLVVQGTADPYGTTAQSDAVVAGVPWPVEALVLEGVGHQPQAEARDAVLAALGRLVARAGA